MKQSIKDAFSHRIDLDTKTVYTSVYFGVRTEISDFDEERIETAKQLNIDSITHKLLSDLRNDLYQFHDLLLNDGYLKLSKKLHDIIYKHL